MAIKIDDSKTFPIFLKPSNNRRESALNFFKRQSSEIPLTSDDMEHEKKEQNELFKIQEARLERKYKLFYDNLSLILRHKNEILAAPRYADISVHYAIKGGGLYVGPVLTSRNFNIAGSIVTVNLKLNSLLSIWETAPFRVECGCGCTAYVRNFSGSPLSGCSQASAYCPNCKRTIRIGNRRFSDYYSILQAKVDEDIETFKKTACRGTGFNSIKEFCNLETMIQELRLKEFDENSKLQFNT